MPINAPPEYLVAETQYHEAETTAQKLICLKKMMSTAPKHKGAEKLLKDIKDKICKLKHVDEKEKQLKRSRQSLAIKREGACRVVFVGCPNSGKSTLLSQLSGHTVEIADYPFTTKTPEVRMIPYDNIKIQGIEIPAIYAGFSDTSQGRQLGSIIRTADIIVVVLNGENANAEYTIVKKELENAKIIFAKERKLTDFTAYIPTIIVYTRQNPQLKLDGFPAYSSVDKDQIVIALWYACKSIRVQTKIGNRIAEKPVLLKEGATIKELADKVHKDFARKFKFAKIWGPSARFAGQQVGIAHKLKDTDVVEVFLK